MVLPATMKTSSSLREFQRSGAMVNIALIDCRNCVCRIGVVVEFVDVAHQFAQLGRVSLAKDGGVGSSRGVISTPRPEFSSMTAAGMTL